MTNTGPDDDRNPIWEPNWHDICFVIKKAKWIIVACSILSAVAVVGRYAEWRPSYVSYASISFLARDVPYAEALNPSQHPLANDPEIYAELQSARSDATLQRALTLLAENYPDLYTRHLTANGFEPSTSSAPVDEWILSNARYSINVETRDPFYIFDIDVTSPSPEFSKYLANALARAYLDDRRAVLEMSAAARAERLSTMAAELETLRNRIPGESGAISGDIPGFLESWSKAFARFQTDGDADELVQSLRSAWLFRENGFEPGWEQALARAFDLTIAGIRQRAEAVRSELPYMEQANWVLNEASLGTWKTGRSEIAKAVVQVGVAAALGALISFIGAAAILWSRPGLRSKEQVERLLGWVHLAEFSRNQTSMSFQGEIDKLRSEILIRKKSEHPIRVQIVTSAACSSCKNVILKLSDGFQNLGYRVALVSCSTQVDNLLEFDSAPGELADISIHTFSSLIRVLSVNAERLISTKAFEDKVLGMDQEYDAVFLITLSNENGLESAIVSRLAHFSVYLAKIGHERIDNLKVVSRAMRLNQVLRPGFVSLSDSVQ
ncbi:hypothetical protein [Mesorhizobium sp. Z1-4]|uniref:hypothetical protein n=1 Tax=Mesorhizobium sp. Z1-4 TaxID=2448478 RepID=UPI000FDC37EC|nr:hypothetical protein [Mesorhizobium sp. Z1-4]